MISEFIPGDMDPMSDRHGLIPEFIADKYKQGKFKGLFYCYTMFIDISGFTAMTQSLMQSGKEGAEVLSSIINSLFTPAIETIYRYEGFISSFAGDAFTSIFIRNKPEYALKAAFEIKKQFIRNGSIVTKLGEFRLEAKIGLSCGKAEYSIIDPGIQHTYYFRGEAIDGCAESEHKARRSEIIADKRFIGRISAEIEKRALSANYFEIYPSDIDISHRKSNNRLLNMPSIEKKFVNSSLLDIKYKGEFREITSVFISFSDEKTFEDGIMQVIRNAHKYGGYFNRVDFGDKGGTMLIIFGAPSGIEKLYTRTADFALCLKDIHGFRFRAGISTGIAFAGYIGSDRRSEYTAIGNVVNISARLMMKAGWYEILACQDIRNRLYHHYNFSAGGLRKIKGFRAPARIYALESRKGYNRRITYKSGYIQRTDETEKLKNLISPIFNGRSAGLVYVNGPAGIGKSRFIDEFMISNDKCAFFYMPCDEILRKSFNPFIHFLRQYFRQSESKTKFQNAERFSELYRRMLSEINDEYYKKELARTEPFIAGLTGLSLDDAIFSDMDPKIVYENTIFALKDFFLAQCLKKPSVLVIDDGHSIDTDSLNLLNTILRNMESSAMAVIMLCRLRDDGSSYDFFSDSPGNSLELKPFGKKNMDRLLEDLLGTGDLPALTKEFIWEKSAGNPFFIEQITLYMSENNLFDSKFNIAGTEYAVPSEIGQILTARIDRLSTKLKEAVKAASVLGREFAVKVLRSLLFKIKISDNDADFEKQIKAGEKEQIWENISELICIFRHALIRDTAYAMQLKERLRQIHNMAGNAIEEIYSDNLEANYEELAEHFDRAENIDKAVCYLEKAGRKAMQHYKNEKALNYFDRLIHYLWLEKNREKVIQIMLLQSNLHYLTGRWDKALNTGKSSLKLADKLGKGIISVNCMLNLAGHYIAMHKLKEAENIAKKSLSLSEKTGYQEGIIKALYEIGRLSIAKGDYDKAKELLLKFHSKSLMKGNAKDICSSLGNIGTIYFFKGDYLKALEFFKKALAISEKDDDIHGISKAEGSIGVIYFNLGQYQKAMACFKRQYNICIRTGNREDLSQAVGNMGMVKYTMGDYVNAFENYEKQLQICLEIGDKAGTAKVYGNMANIYNEQAEYDKALEFYEKQLSICQKLGDRKGISTVYGNMGVAYGEMGKYDEAIDYFDKAIIIAKSLGIKSNLCSYLHQKADLLYARNDKEQAGILNNEALKIAVEINKHSIIFYATLLQSKLEKHPELLLKMLKNGDYSPELKAIANYELWKITGKPEYRQIASDIITVLANKLKKTELKNIMDEINKQS